MAEITMPKLSDTMTEGTLVSWKKKSGEKVSSGEVIAEVETDKATMEMEAFEDGVLSDLVAEGTKVAVGERIAVIGGASAAPAKPEKASAQQVVGKDVSPATAAAPAAPDANARANGNGASTPASAIRV